jgi:hypothetical protein
MAFMHDLKAIAFAYDRYLEIMKAWNAAMPGRLLNLSYEDLVTNQEEETRALLRHCGIDWDDACLFPERNEHHAATPSSMQVKIPIHRGAVGRAKRFERWLDQI